jgi:HSP20 family protein
MIHMSWDPLRDVLGWERLGRLTPPSPESWTPAVDVYETRDSYIVTAEVPGMNRPDIDLTVEDWRLTIRGQRTDRGASGITHFHQVERGHGAFARSFEFAEQIDPGAVSADLTDGVLTIRLPKVPPPPPRRIEVK